MQRKWLNLLLFSFLAACANHIQQQEGDELVFLVDYGKHSSLAFPQQNGRTIEFAYGEWRWFALNFNSWIRVPAVLFYPTAGTLGRREYTSLDVFLAQTARVDVYRLRVDGRKRQNLLEQLQKEFTKRAKVAMVWNEKFGFHFVEWPEKPYTLRQNCNYVLVEWLKDLSLEVSGSKLFSRWHIESEAERP